MLLPGAYYFVRETQKPAVALLRKAGVKDKTIRRITEDNPRRFLSFEPRQV